MPLLRGSFLTLLCLLAPVSALADSEQSVNQILQLNDSPEGVVFEIVTGDADGLQWALPLTRTYIEKLRRRFPELPVAIVTHGQEQFALQKEADEEQQVVHHQVQSLTGEQNIQVHVCGTYAGWRGLSAEDFPDYVNVAAAGPAQINDYVALGYRKIVIRDEDD